VTLLELLLPPLLLLLGMHGDDKIRHGRKPLSHVSATRLRPLCTAAAANPPAAINIPRHPVDSAVDDGVAASDVGPCLKGAGRCTRQHRG